MERDKGNEFDSYFEEKIKINFEEYDKKKISCDKNKSKRAVYLITNKKDKNDVAFIKQIKIFKEEDNTLYDKEKYKETLREIYFLVLLRQVKENYFSKLDEIKIFEDKKFVFIIFRENKISLNLLMELLLLKDEKLIQRIIFYICLELFNLHQNNIVHNDIKPSNILIEVKGVNEENHEQIVDISLCDFGGMRYEGEKSDEYTIYYVAPEHFLNNGKRRNKSDMWSLGIILIEIFYFKDISEKELERKSYEKLKKELFSELGIKKNYTKEEENKINYEKIKEIVKDEKVFHLVEKLVVLDPEKRYSAEDALKSDYLCDFFKNSSFNCDKFVDKFSNIYYRIYDRINNLKDMNDFVGIIKELDSILKEFKELDNKVK